MMALTRIYAPSLFLCLFILAHCLHPHHGDNMTDIDQSVLACNHRHTFNDESSTPHSPSAMLQVTCHQHPRRPYCRQQVSRPAFCTCLTLRRTSSLALPLPARFWPSGELLSQTILARSFLRGTTVPPFLGRLQHCLTFGRLPSQSSHFSLAVHFCHVPTALSTYSLLWERHGIGFCVVSSFVCINLILEWTTDDNSLFSVQVLCSIFFYMYSFDDVSSSLRSISSAQALPVPRGRHGKSVFNFSHKSVVTSLQESFTSRP